MTRAREPAEHVAALLALLALGLWLAAGAAHADARVADELRLEAPRSVALGTGVRAAASGAQALLENPANLPAPADVRAFDAFVSHHDATRSMASGASVLDSLKDRFGFGIAGRGLFSRKTGDYQGWEGRVAAGVRVIPWLSLGVACRYTHVALTYHRAKPERPAVLGRAPDRTFSVKVLTFDAAITVRPLEHLDVSVLGYNLRESGSPLVPTMVGLAVAYGITPALNVGAEGLLDLNLDGSFGGPQVVAGGGLEYTLFGALPLRAGYKFDQGREQHFATAGVGYLAASFAVELAGRAALPDGSDSMVMLTARYQQ